MTLATPSPSTSAQPTTETRVAMTDASCRWALLGLYYGAAMWLVVASVAYLVASMSFHSPAMFAECAGLSYGRMAPLAQNLLLYGFCIPAAWATALWILARLGSTHLAYPFAVMVGAKVWNLGVLVGAVGILSGGATGFPKIEFPLYAAWLLLLGSLFIGVAGLVTLRQRAQAVMHPAQWFAAVGILWFPWIYLSAMTFLQVWPVRGMAQGAVHWWYLAELQQVLLGGLGMGMLLYLLPLMKKQPLPSRYLALFALLTLIFCGGWAGVPVDAPAPAWMTVISRVMAICLLMPVLALALNLWSVRSGDGSAQARYLRFGFWSLLVWTGLLALASVSGLADTTSFTLVQPGLDQLFLQGFVVMVALGGAYYVLPRIMGRELPWAGLVRVHFWLAAVGILLVVIPFLIGGLKQGMDLADASKPFIEVADGTLMPIRVASMGQLLVILGHLILAGNILGLFAQEVRQRLKGFDNTPVGLTRVGEEAA